MMNIDELVAAISSSAPQRSRSWIREDLVTPQHDAERFNFTEMECARIRLICSLHYDIEVDADTLPVVLSLMDELYDTRQRLLSLSAAIAAQDESIQAAILAAMKPENDSPESSTSNTDNTSNV